ncbi:flavodoxin domain-containing protein [Clostridium oceanicum]|uniref:Flavodoxin domain-containing protein n=1 Tax=Clostridium oceanicum TaxID=1543 RepID=A0ABN1JE43_9CLOT
MKSIIIYSTKYGSAEKASELLKENMVGEVELVNIMKQTVPDIKGYDNVILGGSVYIGKIQKKLTNYINENIDELLKKRIALFICSGSLDKKIIQKYIKELFNPKLYNKAICTDTFGYEICFEKMNFIEKFMMKKMKKSTESEYCLNKENIKRFAKIISTNK